MQQQREQIRLQEMQWDEQKGDGLEKIDVAEVNLNMQMDADIPGINQQIIAKGDQINEK